MHIPDGYLSPRTCVVFYAAMAPVWYLAARRVERALKVRQLPLLSLGAAFAFVIMMFNIPVPGGTSGHMAGSVVLAVVLGPWAAVVALTVALALQALFFGDGGITALGANAFNMAFVMSFLGYSVFSLVSGRGAGKGADREGAGNRRLVLASAAGGYAAALAAAVAAALELGVQPALYHDAAGMPLYAPYPLSVTLPAILGTHLVIFAPVEALGTALVVGYLLKAGYGPSHPGGVQAGLYGARAVDGAHKGPVGTSALWGLLLVLIMLTPLGLLATATPWGEWAPEELGTIIGFVPAGMDRVSGLWRGLMPDYTLPRASEGGPGVVGYVASAAIGSAGVVLAIYVMGRLWRR